MPRTVSNLPPPRFGLIGFPAAHSLSPGLFREFCGGRWEYDIIETPSFDEAWSIFVDGPYKAVNVTAPFKEQAFQRADIKSPECRRIKAANILVKTPSGITAHNSDYLAVRELLAFYSPKIRPDIFDTESSTGQSTSRLSIAVIGFGGAGKAALAAAEEFTTDTFSGKDTAGDAEQKKKRHPNFGTVRLFRHNEISEGVKADIIIYTLPKAVPGIDRLDCSVLIEANYKDPCLSNGLAAPESDKAQDSGHPPVQVNHFTYVPGTEWLRLQAELGFPLMIGE